MLEDESTEAKTNTVSFELFLSIQPAASVAAGTFEGWEISFEVTSTTFKLVAKEDQLSLSHSTLCVIAACWSASVVSFRLNRTRLVM